MTKQPFRARLLIVSAPSGAGKTSLTRAMSEQRADTTIAVSHTTREQRAGETNGVDYHFVDRANFLALINNEGFVEHAQVFGNLYGTSRAAVDACINEGKHVLLDIDWQGARQVRESVSGCDSVFILPPSRQVLEQRLRNRQRDDDQVIADRMLKASAEISHYAEYAHIIINDDFDKACADMAGIIDGNEGGYSPQCADVVDLVKALTTV